MKKNKTIKTIIIFIIIFAMILLVYKFIPKQTIMLPQYDLDEIDTKISQIDQIYNENKDLFLFSFITDTHINNEDTVDNNLIGFASVTNNKKIRFGIVGGDLYNAYKTNHSEGVNYIKYVYNTINRNTKKEVFYTKGNHDCNAKLTKEDYISNKEYTNLVLNDLNGKVVFNPNDIDGAYYYKDFEKYNIRVCVLNSFEGEGQEFVFNSKELEFVANNMLNFKDKNNPEEWQVLFVSHTTLTSDIDKFNNIIHAFQNGEKIKDGDIEADYSKQGKGTVIAFIQGHQHTDKYDFTNDYLNIVVQYGFNTKNNIGSSDELCFSVFAIDKNNKSIKQIRFGRGENEEWSYDINDIKNTVNKAA